MTALLTDRLGVDCTKRESDFRGDYVVATLAEKVCQAREDGPAGVLDLEVASDGARPSLVAAMGSFECRLDLGQVRPGPCGRGRRGRRVT
ncbi:hypothetical protein ACFU9F_06865 [Streptomyces zhihengii]|uniref:hypothetical protein n=1 Tax=Streptomyces zhihengii TaxID=1818004 RepID=UPI0036776F31